MTAAHEDDCAGGGEEILTAYGTVAFCAALDAAMRRLGTDAHAHGTCRTVEEIFSQPFS